MNHVWRVTMRQGNAGTAGSSRQGDKDGSVQDGMTHGMQDSMMSWTRGHVLGDRMADGKGISTIIVKQAMPHGKIDRIVLRADITWRIQAEILGRHP